MIKKTVSAAAFALAVFAVPAFAQEADVMRKLQEISEKQDELSRKIDALQAELQIVKVRATQR